MIVLGFLSFYYYLFDMILFVVIYLLLTQIESIITYKAEHIQHEYLAF